MRRLGLIGLWIASVAAAFALGWLLPRAEPSPAVSVTRERVIERGGRGLTADEVRAMLREELAAREGAAGEVAPPVAPPEAAEPSSQVARAQSLVDRALAQGRWTEADREAMRPLVGSLRPEEREALFALVFPAINDGRLHLEVAGPPF